MLKRKNNSDLSSEAFTGCCSCLCTKNDTVSFKDGKKPLERFHSLKLLCSATLTSSWVQRGKLPTPLKQRKCNMSDYKYLFWTATLERRGWKASSQCCWKAGTAASFQYADSDTYLGHVAPWRQWRRFSWLLTREVVWGDEKRRWNLISTEQWLSELGARQFCEVAQVLDGFTHLKYYRLLYQKEFEPDFKASINQNVSNAICFICIEMLCNMNHPNTPQRLEPEQCLKACLQMGC